MNTAYLLIGGNIGDRWQYLESCRNLLNLKAGTLVLNSHVYETKAWGNQDQNDFLNQVLILQTPLDAQNLLHVIQKIEQNLGRQRTDHWGARTMDIDILFFNNTVMQTDDLTIPHPHIADRKFALVPLNEIASDFFHPLKQKYVWQLLENCQDTLSVLRYHEAY